MQKSATGVARPCDAKGEAVRLFNQTVTVKTFANKLRFYCRKIQINVNVDFPVTFILKLVSHKIK